jgi:mannose-6-phosphate isomerase-like protein (cupin superfamily)/ferredoxin
MKSRFAQTERPLTAVGQQQNGRTSTCCLRQVSEPGVDERLVVGDRVVELLESERRSGRHSSSQPNCQGLVVGSLGETFPSEPYLPGAGCFRVPRLLFGVDERGPMARPPFTLPVSHPSYHGRPTAGSIPGMLRRPDFLAHWSGAGAVAYERTSSYTTAMPSRPADDKVKDGVVRAGSGIREELRYGRGFSELLTPPAGDGRGPEVHRLVIHPHVVPGPLHRHDHARNVYTVLEGVLDVTVGNVTHCLARGDSVSIPAGTAHATHNPGEGEAVLLAIYDRSVAADFIEIGPSGDDVEGRIEIDEEVCYGSGECVLEAPDSVQIGPSGVARVIGDGSISSARGRRLEDNCPSGALRFAPTKGLAQDG